MGYTRCQSQKLGAREKTYDEAISDILLNKEVMANEWGISTQLEANIVDSHNRDETHGHNEAEVEINLEDDPSHVLELSSTIVAMQATWSQILIFQKRWKYG